MKTLTGDNMKYLPGKYRTRESYRCGPINIYEIVQLTVDIVQVSR